jgi:hypothetical protein
VHSVVFLPQLLGEPGTKWMMSRSYLGIYIENTQEDSIVAEQTTIDSRASHGARLEQTERDQHREQAYRKGRVTLEAATLKGRRSDSPTVLLRISDGYTEIRRAFSDFSQAVEAAEAYAGAGFWVAMISATGRFLMDFDPRWPSLVV